MITMPPDNECDGFASFFRKEKRNLTKQILSLGVFCYTILFSVT